MVKNKKVYIVRCGEVALKGMNKPYFEKMLSNRIRQALKTHRGVDVRREDGLIVIRTEAHISEDDILKPTLKIFGVDSISPAIEVASDMEAIGLAAIEYMGKLLEQSKISTFKVEAKRADKGFPVKSPDIARQIGGILLAAHGNLKVDVHQPQCRIYVHVKRGKTFIYEKKISGFGGLPLGTNSKGLVLLSGGIDSPVAAFLMAKRGMYIEAVHFHSYPYTDERALEKVKDLARALTAYCGNIKVHSINLLAIQEEIIQHCPQDEMTILIRRFMMRIANIIAEETSCLMLITGENLGQVASQTAEALVVTDAVATKPVMRPLIGMDKSEIIEKAKEIGTYDISILPYEDSCTVFLPKHPKTKPQLKAIEKSESRLNIEALIDNALSNYEIIDSLELIRHK